MFLNGFEFCCRDLIWFSFFDIYDKIVLLIIDILLIISSWMFESLVCRVFKLFLLRGWYCVFMFFFNVKVEWIVWLLMFKVVFLV